MTYTSSRVLPARPPPPRLELNDRPDLLKIQLSRQLLSKEQESKQFLYKKNQNLQYAKVIQSQFVSKYNQTFLPLSILPDYNELGNRGIYILSAGSYGIRQYNLTYNVIQCKIIEREKFHLNPPPLIILIIN